MYDDGRRAALTEKVDQYTQVHQHGLPHHRDGIFKRTVYTTDLNVTFPISTGRSMAVLKVKV